MLAPVKTEIRVDAGPSDGVATQADGAYAQPRDPSAERPP